jgi:sugar phosphate permease
MGLGMAPVLMGSLKLFSAWFSPAAFGTVSGLIQAIGGLGALLASSPMAGLVAVLGWRATFVLFGGLTLLGTGVLLVVVRDRPAGVAEGGVPGARGPGAGLGRVFARGSFWAMAPLGLAGYASIACLQGLWAGPFFMEFQGYSRSETGSILFALGFTGVVGTAIAGWASDRVFRSRKWVVLGGVVPSALFMAPLLGFGAPSSPLGWALDFAAIGFFSSCRSLIYAHAKESMPAELTGTAVTTVNFFIMVGPALMQQAMGLVLQSRPGDYSAALLIPVVSLGVGALVYAFTRDTRPGAS